MEYWVSKRNPDRLLACEHSVVDFEIEGAKIKTNLLFEAATTANSVGFLNFSLKILSYLFISYGLFIILELVF